MDWKEAAELTRKLKSREGSDKTASEYLFTGLIVIAFLAIVGIPLIVYVVWAHALVIKTFWAWFIVSAFDLKPLTWAQAWGLSMIVSYLTHVAHTCKSKDERETSEKVAEFVMLLLKPWIALGIGYVCAHYFLHVV